MTWKHEMFHQPQRQKSKFVFSVPGSTSSQSQRFFVRQHEWILILTERTISSDKEFYRLRPKMTKACRCRTHYMSNMCSLQEAKSVNVPNIAIHHRDKPMSIIRNSHNQLCDYLSRRHNQTWHIDCCLYWREVQFC